MLSNKSDRIFGLIVAVAAVAFFAAATQLKEPFFSDPLGPASFAYLISGVALVCAFVLMFRPDTEPDWPDAWTFGRIGLAAIVLVAYALTLKPYGFLIPTALAAGLLSYQISPRVLPATLTGLGLSGGLFVIFKYLLGLGLFALPKGLF